MFQRLLQLALMYHRVVTRRSRRGALGIFAMFSTCARDALMAPASMVRQTPLARQHNGANSARRHVCALLNSNSCRSDRFEQTSRRRRSC